MSTAEFQFLLVRLKVEFGIDNQQLAILFQFLLVRLKGVISFIGLDKEDVFQFLLVRLKDITVMWYYICIIISIPTGTIKSEYVRALSVRFEKFQFLLVRLKELKLIV